MALVIVLLVLLFSPEQMPRVSEQTPHAQSRGGSKTSKTSALVPLDEDELVGILSEDELDHSLTPLEQDVLRQARELARAERGAQTERVRAENLVQAQQVTINQGGGEQVYVASSEGSRFHKMTCPVVKNMPASKRVTFSTRDDAIKAGYTPCKTCGSHD
jgi:hypothetical protein